MNGFITYDPDMIPDFDIGTIAIYISATLGLYWLELCSEIVQWALMVQENGLKSHPHVNVRIRIVCGALYCIYNMIVII